MKLHIASEPRTLPTSQNAIIQLDRVGVRYMVPHERIASFKEFALRRLRRSIQFQEFWALQDVSLDIHRGETFGVIGRNGAGKSTMLKVISRILRPTRGRIQVRGRVAPLLQLGAGFHTELTGRENVFLNSALLGYSRAETVRLFDDIIDFAEVWEFIDAPLRTYSTGMIARLGFAVATARQPEILLVDEVLSVGDAGFQRRCSERITRFRQEGTTTVLITHSADLLRDLCGRAVWIDSGRVQAIGHPKEIVAGYLQKMRR